MTTNENLNQEIELTIEEAEAVIAPGVSLQHNETVEVELSVEEAEEIIAPGRPLVIQHNETLEVELSVEETEAVIAPSPILNHNQTLLND